MRRTRRDIDSGRVTDVNHEHSRLGGEQPILLPHSNLAIMTPGDEAHRHPTLPVQGPLFLCPYILWHTPLGVIVVFLVVVAFVVVVVMLFLASSRPIRGKDRCEATDWTQMGIQYDFVKVCARPYG